MKSALIIAAITCALSVTLAAESEKVEHANARVADYIREQLIQLPMARSAMDHAACYADLTKTINNLTEAANDKLKDCVKRSALQKASALEKLKQDRGSMVPRVKNLTQSLFTCALKPLPLEYFQCLKTAVDANADLMKAIRENSQQLVDQHTNGMKDIESNEKTCLANVVDETKSKTGEAFETLRACLEQGAAGADGNKAPAA